ncbi:MAG: LysR substrate-binding domain-containing protein [Sediminibacterium sp.]|uniref:LysR substrate-binding domain-containing protein n=1 Tax=Sediminibacterium sp. TaxID=1917865 RepID=UPI002721A8E6|nr:LysR substrate-binding domain-containing protein [Sediminibacterium sp.]MDO8996154.1 LysR substrate-binding domain-containing protein [Sediminibacterium sp.]
MISMRHVVFMNVAEELSFSKASQLLFISQPAISKHIQLLEEQYQTKLFERKGLHIELTAAGKLLYDRLLLVKDIEHKTEFDISVLHDAIQAKGNLKLGASTTVALYILPKVLSSFHQQYQQIEISVLNRNSESVKEALLAKQINLGIIEENSKVNQIQYTPFITDKVVAVCSSKSKLLKKKNYTIQDLPNLPIALREVGSGTLAVLKRALTKHRINFSQLNVKVRLGGTEALKNFLLESDSLGFLPKISIAKELKAGELKEVFIEGLALQRQFFFIERKGETSDLNKGFIKMAKSIYNL